MNFNAVILVKDIERHKKTQVFKALTSKSPEHLGTNNQPTPKKSPTHLFAINFNISYVVLEHGGDVHFRELVLAEHDQQASLSARAVADYHQLLPYSRHASVFTSCLFGL